MSEENRSSPFFQSSVQGGEPSFQDDNSPFHKNSSSFQEDQSPSQRGQQSFQDGQLSFRGDNSSFQKSQQSYQDQPSFQGGQQSFQPTYQEDQSTFQDDQPFFRGDYSVKKTTGDDLETENSSGQRGEGDGKEPSAAEPEVGIVVSEELGKWASELRDEVMMMVPTLQQQEEEDESMVTKAQILLRDAIQYEQKLAALKNQYTARLDQVSSSLSVRSLK